MEGKNIPVINPTKIVKKDNNNKNNIQKTLKDKEYEIKVINEINTNKGIDFDNNKKIYIKTEEYFSEDDDSLDIKEYDSNKDSEKFSINNNQNIKNIEKIEEKRYKENKKLLEKQNVLFVQILGGNDDNENNENNENNKNNENGRKKKIIVSNLFGEIKNIETKNDSPKKQNYKKLEKKIKYNRNSIKTKNDIKNKNGNIMLIKNISLINIQNNKIKNIPVKKNLTKIKKQNKLPLNIQINQNIIKRNNNNNNININNKKYGLKYKNQNFTCGNNNKAIKYNEHINNLNNYINQIKKYYTKINTSKISTNKNNNNKKTYSVNEHNNLIKNIPLLNRNKSVKLCYGSNMPFYMPKNGIEYKNKKEKINNNNNKYKKANIPIDRKKCIPNRNISKRMYTENNSTKNMKKNESNKFIFRSNRKPNDNDKNIIYKNLNINKYSNLMSNSHNLTKNNSFKNFLKNKNARIYDSDRSTTVRYFKYKTNKIKENKK